MMGNVIGVVNYGVAGNVHSIKKAIEQAEGEVIIIDSPEDFNKIDKLVIPGVGSFHSAIQELKNDGFLDALINFKKPMLGICLGMQILATIGYEYGKSHGLGLIDGEVKEIFCDARVPHMGFNSLEIISQNELLMGIEKEEFYFMHSYEMVNYTDISSLTDYAGHKFVSSVKKGNIFGVQFHPEKSREAGIELFKNFIKV